MASRRTTATTSARGSAAKTSSGREQKKVATAGRTSGKGKQVSMSKAEMPSASDAVDDQLAKYRSMRDFHVTAEPAGAAKDGTAAALPFCIQKHAASHLHYDFRLGWNGVLKSWAVAKGPSYVTADKRLAVQVEDHPMEYGGFEGIIPAGQYGGGTVMLWDQGTWEPQAGHEDVNAGLRDGSLKFIMHGEKIKGRWTLVRMGGKAATERKPNWLLIKEHDEFERGADAACVTEAEQTSVVTGRTMEQIAQNEDHVWNSKETAGTGQAWYRKAGGKDAIGNDSAKVEPRASVASNGTKPTRREPGGASSKRTALPAEIAKRLRTLPKASQPSFVKPQLAMEATEPPEGSNWLHELKLDGYRIQARKSGADVALLTRSGLDWTHRVPAVAAAVAKLAAEHVTLDGEVVVLSADGTTNFADLQASFQEGARNPLTYFCFDLLHLEGHDPQGSPLRERKAMLEALLGTGDGDAVRFSEHIESGGGAMFKKACELHAEGIVSKRADAPYKPGRGSEWLKSKCLREQEFVIGGYTLSSDGDDRVGSLLLGYYRDKTLIYAGRTGTGFTQKMRRQLLSQLKPMLLPRPAYGGVPSDAKRGAVWVEPKLVAQVRFATWTAEDLVRQAAFLGLREDKEASAVRREEATVAPQPKSGRGRGQQAASANSAQSAKEESAPRPSGNGSAAGEKFYTRPRRPGDKPRAYAKADGKTAVSASPAASAEIWKTFMAPPVRLTHPAKILDAESGVSKVMLAEYYWAVAERMLPHIAGRPLSLVRCPEGSAKPCFYQKHVNHMLPPGVGSVEVPDKKTGVPEPYITLASKEALAGLAQMGVLEVHPWSSRNEDLEHADRIIFDLDPDEALGWGDVTAAAAEIRARLKAKGLESFLKTTGGKGLHVVAPIDATLDWDGVKRWAHDFVVAMERASPTKYLSKMTKAARAGKIYLDYLRNERGATAVAPYSPRARVGLGVSLPLAWKELESAERPTFRVANFPEWQSRLRTDPWARMAKVRQRLN